MPVRRVKEPYLSRLVSGRTRPKSRPDEVEPPEHHFRGDIRTSVTKTATAARTAASRKRSLRSLTSRTAAYIATRLAARPSHPVGPDRQGEKHAEDTRHAGANEPARNREAGSCSGDVGDHAEFGSRFPSCDHHGELSRTTTANAPAGCRTGVAAARTRHNGDQSKQVAGCEEAPTAPNPSRRGARQRESTWAPSRSRAVGSKAAE